MCVGVLKRQRVTRPNAVPIPVLIALVVGPDVLQRWRLSGLLVYELDTGVRAVAAVRCYRPYVAIHIKVAA